MGATSNVLPRASPSCYNIRFPPAEFAERKEARSAAFVSLCAIGDGADAVVEVEEVPFVAEVAVQSTRRSRSFDAAAVLTVLVAAQPPSAG